jgi:hypothetical protein
MNEADTKSFNRVGEVSSDDQLRMKLDEARKQNNRDVFVNTLVSSLGRPVVTGLTHQDPNAPGLSEQERKDRISNNASVSAAFSAYQLFRNWDKMSPAQKALGVASLGVQTWTSASGETVARMPIIKPGASGINGEPGTPGLNVGQALTLLHAGVNVYSMINNWDQMSQLNKIASGSATASDMAILAKQFKLLGSGQSGTALSSAATAQTNQMIANGTAQSVPELGAGAIKVTEGTALPDGYSVVSTKEGVTTAVPSSNLNTAIGAIQFVGGAAAFAQGAKTVYDSWGKGGARGRAAGAIGGSSMAAGLYAMGSSSLLSGTSAAVVMSNPYLLSAVVVASVVGSTIKTGKSDAQNYRDSIRENVLGKSGLMDDKTHSVTLADGSKVDIGIDGHGGQRSPTNPDRIAKGQSLSNGKLNAYDIDYTNDLDYAAGMGGVALTRLLAGGTSTPIDQMGGQLGNASLGNIGFGKDMSLENFSKMRTNLRAMYSKAGVTDKATAYQLANAAFAEGRINATDYVAMQQSFDMIYDNNGYQKAKSLMAGRFRGVEVAAQSANTPAPSETDKPANVDTQLNFMTGQTGRNTSTYFKTKAASSPVASLSKVGAGYRVNQRSGTKLTKEQIRRLNQERYAQRGAA